MSVPIKSIAVAVVRHRECFVVGCRPPGSELAGHSEFPGGKVEVGESFFDAAVRECLEETALAVRPVQVLLEKRHDYSHARLHLQFIECRVHDLATEELPELAPPFRWVARPGLADENFPSANDEVVQLLLHADDCDATERDV